MPCFEIGVSGPSSSGRADGATSSAGVGTAPSTTTLSTIAVQAGPNANIVLALLKSDGFVHLRIEEMEPKMLSIGCNVEETSRLLGIHEHLVSRLRNKEDQVAALLTRADALSAEKEDQNEAVIYEAMALSLNQAWRELNKQLILRGYMLQETLSFHRMAAHHQQLTGSVADYLHRAISEQGHPEIVAKIEQAINEVIDTTASAVDVGSSVIGQIRALGQLGDHPQRAQEILDACQLIENVMLRIASEWERVEKTWKNEKERATGHKTITVEETFSQMEEWLRLAERKVKALNEDGQKRLIQEGNSKKAKLLEMGASGVADGTRVAHLSGQIEEFLHYVKTRLNRSQRLQNFFQSAASVS